MLDGGRYDLPPELEAGFPRGIWAGPQIRVAKQNCIEGAQNPTAVCLGPPDRIGVCELPVLRIRSLHLQPRCQGTRCEVAAGADIVSGEQVNDEQQRPPPVR